MNEVYQIPTLYLPLKHNMVCYNSKKCRKSSAMKLAPVTMFQIPRVVCSKSSHLCAVTGWNQRPDHTETSVIIPSRDK